MLGSINEELPFQRVDSAHTLCVLFPSSLVRFTCVTVESSEGTGLARVHLPSWKRAQDTIGAQQMLVP